MGSPSTLSPPNPDGRETAKYEAGRGEELPVDDQEDDGEPLHGCDMRDRALGGVKDEPDA